jgi:hypothetical protein
MNVRMKMLCVAALGAGSMALYAPAASGSDLQREDRCDVQARSGHELQTIEMRNLHVLEQTSDGASFAPALPRGTEAIVCLRTSITPAAHDDKVLALGIPLIIVEVGRPHRMGVLEIAEGAYRYRMAEGSLPAADQAAVQARLEEYRGRIAPHAG